MRLTIVQYGGDYREAWERFDRGGKATYQAQRYSVSFVGSLADRLEQVTIICAATDVAYDVTLPNKVRAIGGGLGQRFHPREVIPLVRRCHPDRLVLVTPLIPILHWSQANSVRTLATLADSFDSGGLRNAIRHRRLAKALNHRNIEWVGNHGIGACLSLLKIGVKEDKIIPWDWPPSHTPSEHDPRRLDATQRLKLVYVGTVSEAKGVGDVVRALGALKSQGPVPHLTIIGAEADTAVRSLVSEIGLGDAVHFSGLVPNEEIPLLMRAADVVVIPSRHEYPEGLPLTIYEALSSRTPIIASDHPMFRGALTHGKSALIFPAGNAEALALAIRDIGSDAELYARLSESSEQAWQALQLPVIWGELVERWLSDTPSDHEWLSNHRLSSGHYRQQIEARSAPEHGLT
jgi:glycosyltransferase involved in cell wall biosynthesis